VSSDRQAEPPRPKRPGPVRGSTPEPRLAPAVVPIESVVAESAALAVFVPHVLVFPNGIEWAFQVLANQESELSYLTFGDPRVEELRVGTSEPQIVDITMRYDGRLGRLSPGPPRPAGPSSLGVWPTGLTGVPGHTVASFFVSPLPEGREVSISVQLGANPPADLRVGAVKLRNAAKRCRSLWS
jgi:hypothetical protein